MGLQRLTRAILTGASLAFLLLTVSPIQAADVRVVDGDTIKLDGETIRVMNIDAPEIHPCRCQIECDLGYRAKEFAERFLNGPIVLTRADRKDKYGRSLARIAVNNVDLGEALIARGLARKWEGRRRPWC